MERQGKAVKTRRTKPPSGLTAAEARVLNLISQSKTNREIAVVLRISPATVKPHIENIFRKRRLRNRVEAAIYGLTLRGCPVQDHPHCPLAIWRKDRDLGI